MAQNHQIKMSLMFDTNTSKAKASLKDLQNSINGLTKGIESGDFPMTTQIQEAYVAAEKLKTALNSAVNMQTGKFDLFKLNSELKKSGLTVAELGQKFAGAGAAGAEAFAQLASAVASAELPMKRTSQLAEKMAQSLKQTLQWQLSSSIIHGVTGALQSAYGYAQDLNKSLNDIRIVTGEGADFMGEFAAEANKAAKALSTTTNEYAKASLIFYQQGLSDEDVAIRTAAVIKMANVTGESAQDISSYMTAIWNNFDNGTKSLEYYADAIAALGAATASSTEEIATGMQQFASVAETVGLSYEYAASALATVVAATRQSEETVGTSFKTIFARLSSLSLGETLDDGTTLTKYSAALGKVSIDIKDNNGQLKEMDQILDELGAKWNSISKEQQTALAYTVAGTRQYNNFISLLDNYEEFKINVDLAIDAEGTLNEQQEIYAESWEAAADRARAAAESIFEKLINDDFFIDLLNGLEKFLSGLDRFIDAVGGLPGVLGIISSLMLKIFSTQMADGVRNLTFNIESFVTSFLGIASKRAEKIKQEYVTMASDIVKSAQQDVVSNAALIKELDMLKQKISLEQTYIQFEDQLSQKQKQEYQYQLQMLEVLRQQTVEKQKQIQQAEERVQKVTAEAFASYTQVKPEEFQKRKDQLADVDKAEQEIVYIQREKDVAEEQISTMETDLAKSEVRLQNKLAEAQRNAPAHHGYTGIKYDAESEQYSIDQLTGITAEVGVEIQEEIMQIVEHISSLRGHLGEAVEWSEQLVEDEIAAKAGLEVVQTIANETPATPMSALDAKQELDRYMNYTSGHADQSQQQLLSLIQQYGEFNGNTDLVPGTEVYQDEQSRLSDELDLFITNFSTELDQSLIDIVGAIMEELKKEAPSERKGAEEFTTEATSAHAAAKEKYDQSEPVDETDKRKPSERILEKMKNEVGAEFSPEAQIKINEALEDQIKAYKAAEKADKSYGKQFTKTSDDLKKKAKKDLPDVADRFVSLTSGISSVTAAISALSGVFDVWKNEEMGVGEKLLSTFMSLGTAIPMVVSAFSSFNTALGITNTLQKIMNATDSQFIIAAGIKSKLTWDEIAAMDASAIAKQFKIGLDQAETLSIYAKTAAIGGELSAMTAEQIVEKTGMSLDQANLLISKMQAGATWAEAAAEVGLTGAKSTGIIATIGQTIANIALQASMAPILVITLAIIAALAILAAGILIVVGVVMLLVSAFEAWKSSRPDAILASAEEQAERLGEALKEAKEEADNLRTAIEKYDTAVDKLKGLVQGTDEYREAVKEANDAARELIDTYDSLEYTFNSNTGLIEINEESLAKAQQQVDNKVTKAEINYLTGQNQVKNAERNNTAYQLARKEGGYQGMWVWDSGVFQKREDDTSGERIWKGFSNYALNILTWGLANNIAVGVQEIQNSQQEKGLNNLFEAYSANGQNFEEAFNSLSKSQQRAIEALGMTDDELAQLCAEMHDNTIAVIENNKQIAASLMSDNDNFNESNAKDTATAMAAKDISERSEELFESTYKDQAGVIKDKDIQKAYAEAMGWDPNLVENKNGNKAVYYDKEGNEIGTISDETARRFLAEQAAQKEADRNTEQYIKEAEAAVATIKQYGAGLTDEQADKIAADIVTGKTADLTGLTPAQIEKIRQDTENATDEFSKGLAKGAEEAQKVWNNSLDTLSQTARAMAEEIASTNEHLSQAQLMAYARSIEQVASSFGAGTAEKYSDTINSLIAENEDKAQDIATIASGINWTNGEQGLRDLQGQLSEIGIYINENDAKWLAFAEAMANTNVSVLKYDLETIRAELAEIQSLTNDIEFGGIISDEDYATLLKYNGELSKYFQITADGYRYIGEGDISEYTDSMAKDMLEKTLETNKLAREGAEASKRLDYIYAKEHGIVDDDIAYITSNNNGNWDSTLEALGYDKTELQKLGEQLNSDDEEIRKAAEEKVKKFYDDVEQLQARVAAGEFDDSNAYELNASMYTTKKQLESQRDKFVAHGQIEAYNKQMEFLERQAQTLLAEYNEELQQLRLEELQEQFDLIMDMGGDTAEAIALLDEQSQIYANDIADIQNELNDLANQYGVEIIQGESLSDFMNCIVSEAPQATEKVLELGETLKNTMDNLKGLNESLAESLMNHFETVQENSDKAIAKYEHEAKLIAHYRNMLDLTGYADNNSELMAQISGAEMAYSKAILGQSYQNYEEIKAKRTEAEAKIQEAIKNDDAATADIWQKQLDNILEMERDALEDMNDNWATALETAAEILENNTERIMKSFEQSMAGIYGSFERMQEVFDQQSELHSQYVADYKKVYELSKLTRNITEQIDNTENVKAKQSLREIQEEVNALQANGVKMSEYDLEYLQKKYDLRVAEIALEEAQNAKNQVRLQKMANGSWGYIYTANAEAVGEAQQTYEDTLFELQDLSNTYLEETSSAILSIQAEFNEAMSDIMASGLNDEQKRQQIEETVAFYEERLKFLTSEFDNVISNNQGMADMVQNFADSLLGAMYPSGEHTNAASVFEKWRDGLGSIASKEGVLGSIGQELDTYQQTVNEIFGIVGVQSIEEYANKVDIALNGENGEGGLVKSIEEAINDMKEFSPENMELAAFEDLLTKMAEYKTKFTTDLAEMSTQYSNFINNVATHVGDGSGKEGDTVSPSRTTLGGKYNRAVAVAAFDTGGYTGAWGPSGRLAILHEKELVLNTQDTQNLLHTVEVMDRMLQNIELQAAAASFERSLVTSLPKGGNKDTIQQEVTIHAEFPNATNHSEIEEAFNTLINRAAQFTNRNR